MKRQCIRGTALFAAIVLSVAAAAGRQPTVVPDKITVRNAAKKDGSTVTHEGRLNLTPAGLQVMTGEQFDKVGATINYADIVKYEPGDIAKVNRDEMLAQLKLENNKTKKDYEAAKTVYSSMQKKAGSAAPVPTRRHLEFRTAMMATKIADETGDDEKWSDFADIAVKEWAGFLTEYKSGWEVWPAARTQARLFYELNKFDEAAKVWGRMAKNPELPPDLKLEAAIQEVDAHFRAKAYSTASSLAAALAGSTGPGAAKDRLAILERAAKAAEGGLQGEAIKIIAAELGKRIAESKDPTVRATAFSALGELYLLANKPREAMWEFLWVETVYNSDRDETLKAMCRLVEVFKAQMDEDRPKAYRERIRRFRSSF